MSRTCPADFHPYWPGAIQRSPNSSFKVLEFSEIFEEVDGKYQFTKVLVVCQAGNQLYHGRIDRRLSTPPDTYIEELQDLMLIPKQAYQPRLESFITQTQMPLGECYVKRPSLISYDRVQCSPNPTRIADRVREEVKVYEILKQHPHPNIVTYLGCEIKDGNIAGICLTKYAQTLMQRVNSRSRMKRAFKYDPKTLKSRQKVLLGIKCGLLHLHSLGLVHNDLNPSNIMLLDEDTPVIIDLDSCRWIGQGLQGVGRTYEWFDHRVDISTPQNDLDALEEISEWLSEKEAKKFLFSA